MLFLIVILIAMSIVAALLGFKRISRAVGLVALLLGAILLFFTALVVLGIVALT